mmetsp:Transcript_75715/g.201176  ORF Transcript_75715/g.201176 Transcript_75715/m.201176 type:complete len:340 (-) Transcript_75715:35-1054(-)
MTQRVCEFNWALNPNLPVNDPGVKGANWPDTVSVGGCWNLQLYNTDRYMTSAVYQHARSKRCVLAISGYHGGQNGFMSTMMAATQPKESWKMCGNELHAPVVIQFRKHAQLENWTSIAEFLGGNRSTCRDIVLTGESMGASVSEMMVGCSTTGQMGELQPKELPSFDIKAIYTFGAFAISTSPIKNASSHTGCVEGKRIFHSADVFSQWAKNIGMHHPQMDAMRLYEMNGVYSYDALKCGNKDAIESDMSTPSFGLGGPSKGGVVEDAMKMARLMKNDNKVNTLSAHAIPHMVKQIRALIGNGTLKMNEQIERIDYAGLLKGSSYASLRQDVEALGGQI